jgi:hypothetical protein
MAIKKYNKILDPRSPDSQDIYDGNVPQTLSDEERAQLSDDRDVSFLYDLSEAEAMDRIYIGAGPHEKVRSPIKICDVIPPRTAAGATETFFSTTIKTHYDNAWPSPNVYIRTEPVEFGASSTNIDIPYQLKCTVTKISTGESAGEITLTPNGQAQANITGFFYFGSGEYSVAISLVTNTSVYCGRPLYLIGTAPQDSPWCGVPNIGSDGTMSYDLTFLTPEIAGVEDWEVEVAEI